MPSIADAFAELNDKTMTRKEQIKEAAYEAKAKHIGYGDSVVYAFIDGALWADSHPHWISVEDELPPLYEFFFYFGKNGVVRMMNCSNVHHGRSNEEYLKDCIDCGFITHWMPLPAPPMKGDQCND